MQEENRELPFALRLLSEGLDRLQEVSGYKEMGGKGNDVMSTCGLALLLTDLDKFHWCLTLKTSTQDSGCSCGFKVHSYCSLKT